MINHEYIIRITQSLRQYKLVSKQNLPILLDELIETTINQSGVIKDLDERLRYLEGS